MSAENPPTYNFSGIDFNPSFYVDESNSSGITQEQANTLYLQKTIPDTATALETFSGGIKTNTIDNVSSTDTSNILINSTGNINIGTSSSRTSANPIIIGNGNNSIVRIGTSQMQFNTTGTPTATLQSISTAGINVITAGSTFNFLSNHTATLSIGTAINRSGDINIANTQTTGTGNIVIGSTAITTGSQNITINRPLTIGYTPAKLTNFNQIGYYDFSNGLSSGTITSTHNYLVHSVNSVPDGTYIIIGNITCLGTGCTITLQEFGITTITPPIPTGALTYYPGATVKTSNTFNPLNGTYIVNFSTVCQITGGTIYLSQNTTYTGGTYSLQGRLIITRIG